VLPGELARPRGTVGSLAQEKISDASRFTATTDRLFPGASIEGVAADTDAKQSYADTLLDILSRSGLPNVITTTWIAQQIGKSWREVSKHVMPLAEVQRAIENLGWVYKPCLGKPRKGQPGSTFERRPPIPAVECASDLTNLATVHSPALPPPAELRSSATSLEQCAP
jgi:hypothetical protein